MLSRVEGYWVLFGAWTGICVSYAQWFHFWLDPSHSEWPCLMSMFHEIVYVTQDTMASSPRSGLFFSFSWLENQSLTALLVKSSVSQSHPTLCDPMDCSTPGFPVHHQLWNYSNSYPSSRWCHPTISSPVVPFSSCLQSFPASGFFPMSLFFTSGGQSIGVSVSASVLPMNIQDWFPVGWTGWISLQSKGLSRVFSW